MSTLPLYFYVSSTAHSSVDNEFLVCLKKSYSSVQEGRHSGKHIPKNIKRNSPNLNYTKIKNMNSKYPRVSKYESTLFFFPDRYVSRAPD